jgi:outer membrane protein assembly factor BamB
MLHGTLLLLAITFAPHYPLQTGDARAPQRELAISRVDQVTSSVFIRNTLRGEQVELTANGIPVGLAYAPGPFAQVPLRVRLRPGTLLVAHGAGLGRTAAPASASTTVQNDYLTYHYDALRTGWNSSETLLTDANVGSSGFGELFSIPVDGFVYAQPLYVAGLTVNGQAHNVLYIVTENDSLYAFDADTGVKLWKRTFTDPAHGITPVPESVVGANDISPVIGITSTPVIDSSTGTLYLEATTQKVSGSTTTFAHHLYAVALDTGANRVAPVNIMATITRTDGSKFSFDPLWDLQRPSLLLSGGLVYIGFGSHNDIRPSYSHGFIFAYDATTLHKVAVFCTTIDLASVYYGSLWAAGYGPAADANGNVYFATGNGPFDADLSGRDYGDTVLRMKPNLTVGDYFTPFNQSILNMRDKDLGGGGVMLLPDQSGSFPHLAVLTGKGGTLYLLDRDNLGGYVNGGPDHVLQELPDGVGLLRGGPAYFNGPAGPTVYFGGDGRQMQAFALSTMPSPQLTVTSHTTLKMGVGGDIPVVSSNGTMAGTGIVWSIARPNNPAITPVYLRAFDATNLGNMLFQGTVGTWTNASSQPFLAPTVINGKVYLGMPNSVVVFGLH